MKFQFIRATSKLCKIQRKGVKTIGGVSVALFLTAGGTAWYHWSVHNTTGGVSGPIFESHYDGRSFHLKTLVALARSQDTDTNFFSRPKSSPTDKTIEDDLRTLLSHLTLTRSNTSPYMTYLTDYALNTESIIREKGEKWCFGSADFCSDTSFTPPETQVWLYCLEALCLHSTNQQSCPDIIKHGGLDMLQRVIEARPDHPQIIRLALRIVGNLALYPGLHEDILKTGWIDILAKLMRSEDTVLSLLSARALANLDLTASTNDDCRCTFEDGVYIMHPIYSQSEEIEADVVFIHGLLGGPFKTWRQDDAVKRTVEFIKDHNVYTQCWPKDWLCDDCTNLRVISVEYDTSFSSWQQNHNFDSGNLADRSIQLLEKLKKAGVGSRPVIWVGHSMGGLLIKQMLLQSTLTCPELASLTRGIVFYSVPHHGSKVAQISSQMSFLLFPSMEVKQLSQGSEYLKQLHSDFTHWATDNSIPCMSFVESRKTNIRMKLKLLVVPKESADAGLGELTVLDANHITVCKPFSRASLCYSKTFQFIKQCLQKGRES